MRSVSASPAPAVRRAVRRDLRAIAELHRAEFPRHLVSRLPARLIAALFGGYMTTAVVLVAEDAGSRALLGYALGGRLARLDAVRRGFALDHAVQLAFAACTRHLGAALESVTTILGGRSGGPLASGPAWQLRYIAVRPEVRRRGVAAALLRAFEAAIAPPATEYHAWALSTHEDAVRFYRRHGFEVDVVDGVHLRMIKRLQRAVVHPRTQRFVG